LKFLYLILDIGSLLIPLLFSFHPKIKFYKNWKALFLSLLITSTVFIVWDILFTANGVWGFNNKYLIGINIFNLPLEEWLFFICIPYACIFTHFCLSKMLFKNGLNIKFTKILTLLLLSILLVVSFSNIHRAYTFYNFLLGGSVLLLTYYYDVTILRTFFLSFLIILIPFFLVNGVLTGSIIEEPIVWYNNNENLGVRLFTIPIEDTIYAFSLLLSTILIMNIWQKFTN